MKQNKNTCGINEQIIIAPVFFVLCVILLFVLCSVPTNADSSNGISFSNSSIPVVASWTESPSDGVYIGKYNNGNTYAQALDSDCYCFFVNAFYYVASPTQNARTLIFGAASAFVNPSTYSSDYQLYSTYFAPGTFTDVSIPLYSSLDSALSDLRDFIDNGGGGSSSSDPYDLDYSLPPGNVAFIELTSDSSGLILTTDMPTLSNLFGSAWSNVSQMYGYSNSLPTSGTSFNTSGLSTIDWSKAAPFNVLGQSKNAAKILSVSTSNTYLVIYNPLYFYVRDGGNGAESSFLDNGYIRIRLNDVSNVKVFSLTSSAQIGPNASTEDAISSTVTSSGVTQTIDPDTGLPIWTDSDGNTVEAPGVGTGNIASSGTTTFSILQQIADTISNFFQGSVGAISNLIDNGSSFMSKLGTLYSWLPPPVYAVLTSALILVITIGVIKVFL